MTATEPAGGFAEVSQARLGTSQAPEMLSYVWPAYAAAEPENVRAIAHANMAHAITLTEADLLPRRATAAILDALRDLLHNPDLLAYDPARGDLFFNAEAYLMDRVGRADGGRLHIGRSRIDLLSALMRIRARDGLLRVLDRLCALQATLVKLAARHADTVMQAYTHLQPAQVTTLGHYLIGFVDAFQRDADRVLAAIDHTNQSPLGAAATSGSSWDFSRQRLADLLGFDGVVENTKDAGHNFDWLAEALMTCSIAMTNLGRMTWDLYIWCSHEFGMVTVDGAFAASSSIMPQKRNPYSLEMIRAQANELASAPTAILNVLMGDSGGTSFDLKLVGQRLSAHVLGRTADMLELLTGVLRTLHVNDARMRARAGDGFSTAVGLVEHLVRSHGLSFRTAHHIVGVTARLADQKGLEPGRVTAAVVRAAAAEVNEDITLTDQEIRAALDAGEFVASRVTAGGPAPQEVRRMADVRAERLAALEAEAGRRHDRVTRALHELERR